LVGKISAEICRETARQRFGVDRMTRQYLERYEMLVREVDDPDLREGELLCA
jgi:hypothetical protein